MFDQLKNLRDIASMMGNLGDLKGKAEAIEKQLAEKTVEAESGAGAVRAVVNGKCELLSIRLEPAMLAALSEGAAEADRVMVEELIVSAVNAAVEKAHVLVKDSVGDMMGGMPGG